MFSITKNLSLGSFFSVEPSEAEISNGIFLNDTKLGGISILPFFVFETAVAVTSLRNGCKKSGISSSSWVFIIPTNV